MAIYNGFGHFHGEKLDLMKLNRYLLKTVPSKWKRKVFADFDYINIMLTNVQWAILIGLIIILNIILCIVYLLNDVDETWKTF